MSADKQAGEAAEREVERLKGAKDDAERSRDDAIGRCVAAQEHAEAAEARLEVREIGHIEEVKRQRARAEAAEAKLAEMAESRDKFWELWTKEQTKLAELRDRRAAELAAARAERDSAEARFKDWEGTDIPSLNMALANVRSELVLQERLTANQRRQSEELQIEVDLASDLTRKLESDLQTARKQVRVLREALESAVATVGSAHVGYSPYPVHVAHVSTDSVERWRAALRDEPEEPKEESRG